MAGFLTKRSGIFFSLKGLNTLVISVWSFLLAYVLIRLLGNSEYASFAKMLAVSAIFLQFDLGISGVLYARFRRQYLSHGAGDAHAYRFFSSVFLIFLLIAFTSSGCYAVFLYLAGATHWIPFGLLFLGAVLNLPWSALRQVANANDHYIRTEGIEFIRRLVLLGSAAAMLGGLPFNLYALINCVIWIPVFFMGVSAIGPYRDVFDFGSIFEGIRDAYRENRRLLSASSIFSLIEFGIYVFPYYLIPFVFPDPVYLILYDVFFKVTRFGATSYLVTSETLLPIQTRHFFAGELKAARFAVGAGFAASFCIAAAAAAVLILWGDVLFARLLNNQVHVSREFLCATVAMLFAMSFQASSGSFLVGVGLQISLMKRAIGIAAGMLFVAIVAYSQKLVFDNFLLVYVFWYSVGALFYVLMTNGVLSQSFFKRSISRPH